MFHRLRRILDRILDWLVRDNTRAEATLAKRSTHWLIVRCLFGVAFIVKGVLLLVHGPDPLHHALGPFAILGGLAFAYESLEILLRRTKPGTRSVELE
ncbi:MAG: hypothetical protein WDN31_17475 [Hyphomicrobium sp.]